MKGHGTGWQGPDSDVCREVAQQAKANLESYRVNPPLLDEQAGPVGPVAGREVKPGQNRTVWRAIHRTGASDSPVDGIRVHPRTRQSAALEPV